LRPLPARTRSRFCPRCSLQGALELAEDDAIPPLEKGRVIGDYEMLEILGRGGMGVVYRARQRSLNRLVAVKLLVAGEFADDAARRRFQAEAAAAARLHHPHIVAIHDIGDHEGQPYFSMELVEGRTFADVAREGPLNGNTAARLLKPVADAIQFAHAQGVLHRDLKPSNLLVDAFGLPRVSDFGLARRLDAPERFTLTGEVLGSPSYLAPEQARGDRASEGPASDVYSLGAILYHLLTGRAPFLGASPQAILREVIENEPIAPRQLNPTLPIDLETICLKCLEKEPARRYGTAQELADELNRFLTHEPLRARPVGWCGRSWRWSLRHPAKAGLMLALLVTLLTLSLVPTLAYLRVSRAEQERAGQLRETLLTQARAVRLGGHSGQQRDGWTALVAAARPINRETNTDFHSRLRREAIANLALDDAWFEPATNLPPDADATLLSFDARQEVFAAGEFHGRVRLVRAFDSRPLGELAFTNHTLQHVVEFSPDRRFLALRHQERIGIWDLTNQVMVLSEIAGLNQFSFLSGGQSVAFLGTNHVVCLALPSGTKLWEKPTGDLSGRGVIAFSPDQTWLALGLEHGRGLEIHQVHSPAVVRLLMPSEVTSLVWSRDGRWLGAGGADGSIRLWEWGDRFRQDSAVEPMGPPFPPAWTFETHDTAIQAMAFSPGGRWLAVASNDETIRLIDVRAGRTGLSFPAVAYRLGFSSDGGRVGPVWQGGRAGWLRLRNSPAFKTTRFQSRNVNPSLAMSSSGNLCAVANSDAILVFGTNLEDRPSQLPLDRPRAAYFLPGGLLALTFTNLAYWPLILDTNSHGFGPREESPLNSGGESASFSPDLRTKVFANYRMDSVDVTYDGQLRHRLAHPRVVSVALHPDSKLLVSASLDLGETHLWNAQTGERLATWPDEGANRAAFSADGQWLVQVGPKCVVRDTKTWKAQPLLTDVAPNATTADAAFSPDGRWLAVIMADRELHLLRTKDFATVAVLESPSQVRLHRIAWNQNGGKLAVLAARNELQVWDLKALRAGLRNLKADWPE
jgi:WD40 repeat protein